MTAAPGGPVPPTASGPSKLPSAPASARGKAVLMAQTLAVGGTGGAIFAYLGTPLPWMLGALFATMIASMSGIHLYIHQMFRRLWLIVLGVTLGSSFTPEVLDNLHLWVVSFAGMCVFVVFGTWLSYQIFVRLGHIDRVTAFFCASPGGLGEMIILGPALGGNERTIVLIHATRVMLVMAIIPPAYSLLAGYVPPANLGGSGFFWELQASDLGLMAVAGTIGAAVAKVLRIPAWQMIGPMLASAAVHAGGWTEARPPSDFIAIAQLVVGSGAGSRFSGIRLHELARPMAISGMATVCLLLLAAGAAVTVAEWTGLDFRAIHLAYAPGGFAEMSLIALTLGIEVPFVSLHHLGRMIIVVTGATAVASWAKRKKKITGSRV